MTSLDKTIVSQHDTMAFLGKTIASRDKTIASRDKTIVSRDKTIASRDKTIASLDAETASRGLETASRALEIASHGSESAFRGLEIAIRGCFMEGLATKRAIMQTLLAEAFNCSTQKKLGLVAVFSNNEFTHSSLFYFIKKCKTNVLCK